MRHNYATRALVLGRASVREAGVLVFLLTPDLGLVRARAEGLRKPGSKLAHALQTFSESDVILLRGKDGWRLSGAVLVENHFASLAPEVRLRAGRIAGLLLRLVHGEQTDPILFDIVRGLLIALPSLSPEEQDAAECIAALRVLNVLGLDAGPVLAGEGYKPEALALSPEERRDIVGRINRGIVASGL
ncbi:MAG: repair protein RecO, repair protein RecO [Parcubacteria group bacterium]|nr:repair protein RecO, repair protein RecO [Parcubacteria group bacterium]